MNVIFLEPAIEEQEIAISYYNLLSALHRVICVDFQIITNDS